MSCMFPSRGQDRITAPAQQRLLIRRNMAWRRRRELIFRQSLSPRRANVFILWNSMKIIGIIGDDWYHVWFPVTGEYGFVQQRDLTEGNG